MFCPMCDEEEVSVGDIGDNIWDLIGETVICPSCGVELVVHAEESYDPETGEERAFTYLDTWR